MKMETMTKAEMKKQLIFVTSLYNALRTEHDIITKELAEMKVEKAENTEKAKRAIMRRAKARFDNDITTRKAFARFSEKRKAERENGGE